MSRFSGLRQRHGRTLFLLGLLLGVSACSAKYLNVPARVDLQPHGRVALVRFAEAGHSPALAERATRRFAEELLASQWGVELLELDQVEGAPDPRVDPAGFALSLGATHEVGAVFIGQLVSSGVEPAGGLGGGGGLAMRAGVSADLAVQLLSTTSGATLWRSSGRASRIVGAAALRDGVPSVAVRHPEHAWDEVIGELAWETTHDFRPRRVRQ